MRFLTITLSLFCLLSFNANAQKKLSGHINTGLLFPFNDFSDNSFRGVKPNSFVSIGLGYDLPKDFRLRGDLNAGLLNGDNNIAFYETSFYEAHLFAEYNVLKLIDSYKKSKFQVNVNAGTGLIFYYSKLYDITTRARIAESPNPAESSYSANPMLTAGFNLGYAITPNLNIHLGYTQRAILFNDFMDAFDNGDANDYYGGLNVGMSFTFKKVKDKTKVEVDKKRYNNMIATIDSLDKAASKASPEKMARLEMESQEKDLKISALESTIDSMNTRVASVGTDRPGQSNASADAEAILSNVQYRIIVGSMPTRELAQKWISRSNLDQSEMVVVYVEDIDTYRIIYKSYDSFAAAKKELPSVKSSVPDAWIIKL
jgi:hypothetical protein